MAGPNWQDPNVCLKDMLVKLPTSPRRSLNRRAKE
jgi:hypothetical protein